MVMAAATVIAYQFGLVAWVTTTFSSVEALRTTVAATGPWAPLVFVATQAAQVFLAPVPGGVVVVAGTVLFGMWPGLVLSVAGAVVGSALLFGAIRRWGHPVARRLVGQRNVEKYGSFDDKGRLFFLLLLLPFTPDDIICALAGLSRISLRRFLLLVVLGRTPSWAVTGLLVSGALQSTALERFVR